jgi:ammonia channel protein AmtB
VADPVIGLFYGGGLSQLAAQAIGTATCFVFVFVSFYVYFKVAGLVFGNRVSPEVEIEGLDLAEVGALAYPDFRLHTPIAPASTVSAGVAGGAVAPGHALATAEADAT